MRRAVLAIDQGTTNTKALLIDSAGAVVAKASHPTTVHHPQPGWAEQSAVEIWSSVMAVVQGCLERRPDATLAAIGVSNQRESVVLWDRATGRPASPCVTWQCRRSAERLARLREPSLQRTVIDKTGLPVDPLFPASKIAWLLDAQPGLRHRAQRGELCAGTVDSWLIFNLTGRQVHATDTGNAARTQLLDIHRRKWDEELADLFNVPVRMLPDIRPSDSKFGETTGNAQLRKGVPVLAVMGDSHAALFGHGVRTPGAVKATYGTGTSLMTLTNRPIPSEHGLSTTIAWTRGTEAAYGLEGNITVSGQVAAFMRELLGLEDENALTRLAQTVSSSEGVCCVPALAGMGAPYWRDDARGLITGMSLATRPAHVARAALDAIALQVRDVFTAMEADLGAQIDELSADGGASCNELLMQIQADVLDRPVRRNSAPELSAVGVGLMAGIGAGLWNEEQATALFQDENTRFLPKMTSEERVRMVAEWQAAIRRALGGKRVEPASRAGVRSR